MGNCRSTLVGGGQGRMIRPQEVFQGRVALSLKAVAFVCGSGGSEIKERGRDKEEEWEKRERG